MAIEQGRYEPPAPGEALNQQIAALQPPAPGGIEGQIFSNSPTPQISGPSTGVNPNPQLQILQMAAQGIRLPPAPPPEGAIVVDPQALSVGGGLTPATGESSEQREKMEKALMQLYGMGHGINSYPTGVATPNPFLHPAMFSTTGKSELSIGTSCKS